MIIGSMMVVSTLALRIPKKRSYNVDILGSNSVVRVVSLYLIGRGFKSYLPNHLVGSDTDDICKNKTEVFNILNYGFILNRPSNSSEKNL